jgi:hypothetical protein
MRRTLLVAVAFVYLFVGLAHTMSCVDQAVAATVSAQAAAGSLDESSDNVVKHGLQAAEHCHVCAPGLTPALSPIVAPSARPFQLPLLAQSPQLEDHSRLETPPPRHLI